MKLLTIALGVLATAPFAEATNITLSSASTGPSVFLSNGVLLAPNGSHMRVGTLNTPGDFSSFVDFGTATVRAAGFGVNAQNSKVVGEVINSAATADSDFNSDPIYIWIYNATEAALPAAGDARNLVEQGLFQSSILFPVNDDAGVGDDIQVESITFLTLTPVNLPFQLQQASVNATGDNGTGNATGGRFVLGMGIPEPSTGLLAAGALLVMARRRRK